MFLLAHTGLSLGVVWAVDHCGGKADVPLVLIGANLPDLIDKPIGVFAPDLGLGAGRGLAHTLAFNLGLALAGLVFWRGLLWVALACLGHLVLDSMWRLPRVLFWPLLGTSFPRRRRRGVRYQLAAWWQAFRTEPRVYLGEIGGALFLLAWMWRRW